MADSGVDWDVLLVVLQRTLPCTTAFGQFGGFTFGAGSRQSLLGGDHAALGLFTRRKSMRKLGNGNF